MVYCLQYQSQSYLRRYFELIVILGLFLKNNQFIKIIIIAMLSPRGATRMIKYLYTTIKDEVNFTQAFKLALKRKLQYKQTNNFLRLEISSGQGCEGYTYKFKFDDNLKNDDFVLFQNQQKVVFALGNQQIQLMKGSTLDFSSEMMRQMFYVKSNPQAQISCSCKTSFSPKGSLV